MKISKELEVKPLVAIGLMSGTSFDGIDVALIETDGESISLLGPTYSQSYEESFRSKIRTLISNKFDIALLAKMHCEIADLHANAIKTLMLEHNLLSKNIDVIGFPGQTLYHDSEECLTFQVGNSFLLSALTKIDVVSDFRTTDVAYGGQGAPLVPLYHEALFKFMDKPLAVLNIGGVANITYIGSNDEIIAFDCGPGCALMDDFIYKHSKKKYDHGGEFASQGMPNDEMIVKFLDNDYFKKAPPKSLDRNSFLGFLDEVQKTLSPKDAAATIVKATAAAINNSMQFFKEKPTNIVVCGGGRHNAFLMNLLRNEFNLNAISIDDINLPGDQKVNGDFVEAQAFGFLAVRSLYNKPLSLPSTTGVVKPISGGAYYKHRG